MRWCGSLVGSVRCRRRPSLESLFSPPTLKIVPFAADVDPRGPLVSEGLIAGQKGRRWRRDWNEHGRRRINAIQDQKRTAIGVVLTCVQKLSEEGLKKRSRCARDGHIIPRKGAQHDPEARVEQRQPT